MKLFARSSPGTMQTMPAKEAERRNRPLCWRKREGVGATILENLQTGINSTLTCGYWIFCPTLPSAPWTSSWWRQISASQVKVEFILRCLITEILGHLIPAVFEGFTESDDLSIWEYVVAGSMSTTPPSGAPRHLQLKRRETGDNGEIRVETCYGNNC